MAQIKIRNCCVPSCKETHETCESFFRFPVNPKDIRRWKSAIGLSQDFQPNVSTFVCIKHFMERDIAQRADRKTGQKARLKILSTPRLFLEPIKEEPKKNDEETTNLSNEVSNCRQQKNQSTIATEVITIANFINHLREKHSKTKDGKRKRAKISNVIPLLEVAALYSSDSDCDYEMELHVKKKCKETNKNQKQNDPETPASINPIEMNVSESTVSPEKAKSYHAPNDSELILRESTKKVEVTDADHDNLEVEDDFEDALTPTVIPKPGLKNVNSTSPNMHPKKREYIPIPEKDTKTSASTSFILPPKKNYSNIMVASINDNGEIVEQIEELVTADPVETSESQDELSQLIEVDFSENIEEPSASSLPPAELLQTDDANNSTDDETADGIVRICYECKHCKEMFLSVNKTLRHFKQVHNMTAKSDNLKHLTRQYPYKNFRMVNGVRAFTCSICLMLYYNVQSLKKHQTITHAPLLGLTNQDNVDPKPIPANSNLHVCHVCQKSFLNPENLRSHLLLHVDGNADEVSVYKCDQCGLGFEYEAALTKHTVEHHQTLRLYTCEYCNDAFSTGADLIEHIQHHLNRNDQTIGNATDETLKLSELVLACPEDNCNMQFKESNDYYSHILYQHRKVYQDDPKFIEYIQMVDPETLNEKRQKGQSTSPKYNCKICDRKFTHFSFLKAHEAGKNKFKYECSECEEKTPSKVCLIRHYNVRHDKNIERLHFCTDCPKSFPRKAQLLNHISTHRNDGQTNIYHCNLDGCDRIFADQTTYHFHLSRLHPNAKNVGALVCKYTSCNARFRHETMLKQHIIDEHLPENASDSRMRAGQNRNLNSTETFTTDTSTKEQNIFFGHSEKYDVTNVNGTMDLNIPDSLMLNDVCNEVTIYTDF